MTQHLLLALLGFAIVSTVTPGPNNLMLMASGANFGYRRTVPHMLGITFGIMLLVVLVGLGLMGLFDAWPPARTWLSVASVAYLVWLAWKIANAAAPGAAGQTDAKPFTALQAALFQWVNPKAWSMALTAITLYAPGRESAGILLVAFAFGAVSLPSISIWVLMGQRLRLWLTSPRRLRAFNWTMAALLLATLYPVLYPSA